MKSTDRPVVVSQIIQATTASVWTAITDADQMRQWFFSQIQDFQPTVGFETQFDVDHDGKVYPHIWKILESRPREQIVYDWQYQNLPGRGIVTWDLAQQETGTKLTITNEVLESFPDDDPAFQRESCVAGWEYFMGTLKDFFEQGPA